MFNTSKNVWWGPVVAKKFWLPKVVDNFEGVDLKFFTKKPELNTLTSVCQTLTFQMSHLQSCNADMEKRGKHLNWNSHSWRCTFFHLNLDLEILGKCFTDCCHSHQCLLMFKVFAALLIYFDFFILPIYSQLLLAPCIISSPSLWQCLQFSFHPLLPYFTEYSFCDHHLI